MYIKRTVETQLEKLSKSFPVVMITGSRQVGKTTLLNAISKQMYNPINYISLDNLSVRALALEDPEMFIEKYKASLVIDEFQYAPNLLSYIKLVVDKKRQEHLENDKVNSRGLYYLTSTQTFNTMQNVSESLAGRVRNIRIISSIK